MSEVLLGELDGPLNSVVAINSCPGKCTEDNVSDVFSCSSDVLERGPQREYGHLTSLTLPYEAEKTVVLMRSHTIACFPVFQSVKQTPALQDRTIESILALSCTFP